MSSKQFQIIYTTSDSNLNPASWIQASSTVSVSKAFNLKLLQGDWTGKK